MIYKNVKTFSAYLTRFRFRTKLRNILSSDRTSKNFPFSLPLWNPSHENLVPDRRCRILLKVVLVRLWVTWVQGIWRGEGWGEGWERGGQFTSNLRPRWTDPVTARRVPSKWKGVRKGSKGNWQGETVKQGEYAMYIVIHVRVYKRMPVGMKDTSCIYS
jgi:hypothetical protein